MQTAYKLLWTSYLDDFLSVTQGALLQHAELCVLAIFEILGWKLSSDKHMIEFEKSWAYN